jgi:pimeloyl-ACP methyl ester carboxylesterase
MKAEFLKTLVGTLGVVALSACTVAVDTQDLLRPTTKSAIDSTVAFVGKLPPGYRVSRDFIPTGDGETLYQVRLEHQDARTTVLYWGGNRFSIDADAPQVAQLFLHEWRPNIVFVDYRGHGKSSGRPSLAALERDARHALVAERRRATSEGRNLVICGHSLGGAIAGTVLSADVDGAILMATFTTMRDLVSASMPWYYVPFFTVKLAADLNRLNTTKAVAGYRGPLLIVAGERDVTTPPGMARAIHDASATASVKKHLMIVPGTDHDSVHDAVETRVALLRFARANRL